ncbi:MAG: hypothetical protein R3B45_10110 [Bdellovibrionota bacterium]
MRCDCEKKQKNGESIKAFIVKKDSKLIKNELMDFISEKLTAYKRPKEIEFVTSLPQSDIGKILKKDLK